MELDLHRHGQLNVMAIIAPTVSEKTGLWVCGCALVPFSPQLYFQVHARTTLECNEKGEDAGDSQSFNELIEE